MLMLVGPTNHTGMQNELHAQGVDPGYISAPGRGQHVERGVRRPLRHPGVRRRAGVHHLHAVGPSELDATDPIAAACHELWTERDRRDDRAQHLRLQPRDLSLRAGRRAGGGLVAGRRRPDSAAASSRRWRPLPAHRSPGLLGELDWTADVRSGPPEFSVQVYDGETNTVATDPRVVRGGWLMVGVLDGVRVIDLSWGIAGPMATMLLADNGADVTRIERPDGDPFEGQTGYRVWHRGKRSAGSTCAPTPAATPSSVAGLAGRRRRRVVLARARPSSLGIDHATLAGVNPRLVTCSITGVRRPPAHHATVPATTRLVAARTGLLFDQKGRRGSAMEYIAGRPGPHPELRRPRRHAARRRPTGSGVPALDVAQPRRHLLRLARHRGRAAGRGRSPGAGSRWRRRCSRARSPRRRLNWQRVEHPDAPLYWMWPTRRRGRSRASTSARDGRWVHHWTVRPNWVLSAAEGDELRRARPRQPRYRDDPDRVSMDPEGMLTGIVPPPAARRRVRASSRRPPGWRAGAAAGMGVALRALAREALADPASSPTAASSRSTTPRSGRIRHVRAAARVLRARRARVRGPAPRPGPAHRRRSSPRPARPPPRRRRRPRRREDALGRTRSTGIRVLDLGLGVAGPFAGPSARRPRRRRRQGPRAARHASGPAPTWGSAPTGASAASR